MFKHLVVGDTVTRMLAGLVPMKLKVVEVNEATLVCGGGWIFDRETGAEIDSELGWDNLRTGSYLVREEGGSGEL